MIQDEGPALHNLKILLIGPNALLASRMMSKLYKGRTIVLTVTLAALTCQRRRSPVSAHFLPTATDNQLLSTTSLLRTWLVLVPVPVLDLIFMTGNRHYVRLVTSTYTKLSVLTTFYFPFQLNGP